MAKYWFRRKTPGYGATPSTWEGWTLSIAGILLLSALVFFSPAVRDDGARALLVLLGGALVIGPFSYIAWRKTEGGWRRGKD